MKVLVPFMQNSSLASYKHLNKCSHSKHASLQGYTGYGCGWITWLEPEPDCPRSLPAARLRLLERAHPAPALHPPRAPVVTATPHSPRRLLWGQGEMINLIHLMMLSHISQTTDTTQQTPQNYNFSPGKVTKKKKKK